MLEEMGKGSVDRSLVMMELQNWQSVGCRWCDQLYSAYHCCKRQQPDHGGRDKVVQSGCWQSCHSNRLVNVALDQFLCCFPVIYR